MNTLQKYILMIYLSLTAMILTLDRYYPGENFVRFIKFGSVVTLFVIACILYKRYPVQKIIAKAVFFVMLGDFFFIFYGTISHQPEKLFPIGVLSFAIAYLLLIVAFQRNFSIDRANLLAALPVLGTALPVILLLFPFTSGINRLGLALFSGMLCYSTWTSICTLFRSYFTRRSAITIALAGFLMLLCDLGVGISALHPDFAGTYTPWLKNLVWGCYIPAWTLIVIIIAESDLIANY